MAAAPRLQAMTIRGTRAAVAVQVALVLQEVPHLSHLSVVPAFSRQSQVVPPTTRVAAVAPMGPAVVATAQLVRVLVVQAVVGLESLVPELERLERPTQVAVAVEVEFRFADLTAVQA